MAENNPRIALILGSGAARGLVHIGVIDWLQRHGIEIYSIAGSSMGAVVGGIHAAGELEKYRRWVCALDAIDVVRLLDISLTWRGLVKGEKIVNLLRKLVGDYRIEDLPIRFTAVAADLEREEEIWLTEGDLFDAVRSSFAIPTLLPPHQHRGRLLFDGGLLNPLPIAPTFSDHVDFRIAVNLNARPDQRWDIPAPRPEAEGDSGYRKKIKDFIAGLGYSSDGDSAADELSLFDIALASFDTMQGSIARMKLAAYPPDIAIDVPRNRCRAHEFYRAAELIDYGYEIAEEKLAPLFSDPPEWQPGPRLSDR